jgi:peroxiredoxin
MATLSVGHAAPPFTLSGVDGKSYALDNTTLTLAVFFKTTCPVCMLAWPYLERMHQAYKDAGLAVWGISQHQRDVSKNFASKYGSTFPILIDADWHISRQYDPAVVPTLFLIDGGKIVERVDAFNKAELNRLSNVIATRLGAPTTLIARDDDGNPPFRPG